MCLLLQLYNEDINDLLAPENLKLPIHESKENGVYVAGLREDIVVSPEQVLELLREGEANRHIGATKMNEGSSRSHTVFRMVRACTTSSGALCCGRAGCTACGYSNLHVLVTPLAIQPAATEAHIDKLCSITIQRLLGCTMDSLPLTRSALLHCPASTSLSPGHREPAPQRQHGG